MATVANARLQELQSQSAAAATSDAGGDAGGVAAAAADRAESGGGQPLYPPAPMIGHLTNEEIEALNDVFSRMEMFEAEESARIRYKLTPLLITAATMLFTSERDGGVHYENRCSAALHFTQTPSLHY